MKPCPWLTIKRALLGVALLLGTTTTLARAAEPVWQWSVPIGEGRAFLWIPENCAQVRGIVVGQHNMIEQGVLEHATMRRALTALGFAEVFIAPPFDRVFAFDQGAGERFDALMRSLGAESGYDEIASAPVVPIGHSACASFPWNFAAWNPARTLAAISLKGDAPLTHLTGSGAPNPAWGTRTLDGVPGLMVMSEAEWWEARLAPALEFRAAHPAAPLALLADAGRGHFDASDALVDFLALFIRKAAEARLAAESSALRPVDPRDGWLVDRWRGDASVRAPAAPAARYTGDRAEAFWCFDEAMARATERYYSTNRGKKIQQVNFVQNDRLTAISTQHAGVELAFIPREDGVTFQLAGEFITPLPPKPPVAAKDAPPPPKTVQPTRAAPGTHAAGAVRLSRITGPAMQLTPDTFCVHFDRTASTTDRRHRDVWLLASHPGDDHYKGAVQQALLKLPPANVGQPQTISFPAIANQSTHAKSLKLLARSEANLPVSHYVREGPAFVSGDELHFTALPPRAKFPVKVTVVAWQWGRRTAPQIQAAAPVTHTFYLLPPAS